MTSAMAAAEKPTSSETRDPKMSELRTSLPPSSVPSAWLGEGAW
jgi:hypothetical protein